ncbi:hypothetical protein GCM10011534_38630 [Pseudooceanicola nanhaiensis]|jgi:uncharacterized protein YkwD|uniref:SCP domain-containing protein n=1 Tax=Pseudooceanicola nanhaiensis TaxID=375761 RepID=A0A917T7T5_9RHOB|nr:hypothetical protein GCM10011534_38630 [Pseudooceanicola nanhaiensis]
MNRGELRSSDLLDLPAVAIAPGEALTVIRRRVLAWAGMLSLALLVMSGQASGAEDIAALRAAALEHVNTSRQDEGLPPLEGGDVLDEAAQLHAEDMLERGYYSHVTPGGDGPRERFLDAGGGEWELVAENIAMCRNCGALDRDRISQFHEGWMDSPEHRANILRRGLARFGFGAASGDGVIYAVQTFAGPGTSRGKGTAEVEDGDVMELAGDELNAARHEAGLPPVAGSSALREAILDAVPSDLDSFRLQDLDLFATMPRSLRAFRDLKALMAECGGCGQVITEGDVRAFVNDWLDQDARRANLFDPQMTHYAMVVRRDGRGRKLAILVLAAER